MALLESSNEVRKPNRTYTTGPTRRATTRAGIRRIRRQRRHGFELLRPRQPRQHNDRRSNSSGSSLSLTEICQAVSPNIIPSRKERLKPCICWTEWLNSKIRRGDMRQQVTRRTEGNRLRSKSSRWTCTGTSPVWQFETSLIRLK